MDSCWEEDVPFIREYDGGVVKIKTRESEVNTIFKVIVTSAS